MINDGYDWEEFDAEEYFLKNYSVLHEADRKLFGLLVDFWTQSKRASSFIDVGTGTNLYPLIAASAFANHITVWEHSSNNCAWISRTINEEPLNSAWEFYFKYLGKFADLSESIETIRSCDIVNNSIFELPQSKWHAATMFFCAESITSNKLEFKKAIESFTKCLLPGGHFFCAFMEGSNGYMVGENEYPALNIGKEHVREALEPYASEFEVHRINLGAQPIRDDYSGMIYAKGRVT